MTLYDPESHQPGKPAALVEFRAGQKRGERGSTDSSNSAEEEGEEKEEGVVASRAHPPKSTRTSFLEIGCKQGCECQHMIDISSKPIPKTAAIAVALYVTITPSHVAPKANIRIPDYIYRIAAARHIFLVRVISATCLARCEVQFLP